MTALAEPVRTATRVAPLAITGAGVVSPVAVGLDALADVLRTGHVSYSQPTEDPNGDYPAGALWAVRDADMAGHLARKGMRNVDRLGAFGLVACKLALDEAGPHGRDGDPGDIGVVMATSTGSLQSCAEVALDTVRQEKPYMVNPGKFPNVVMNGCAGNVAIFNGLKNLNATIAGGQVSSLAALRYARSALATGRAKRLLVGGVEELCPILAWGWQLSGALVDRAPVGEGAAMFLVEDEATAAQAGRRPLADLLACEVGYYGGTPQRQLAAGLEATVRRAMQRSGVEPDEVDLVALGATNHVGLDGTERRTLHRVLGRNPAQLRTADILGECYSASGAMQVAAVLALWRQDPAAPGEVGSARTALVTSAGNDGNVGCVVLRERLHHPPQASPGGLHHAGPAAQDGSAPWR
jgi:3-oxoacyl-[acyl-carrier-protein] synthase II